MYIVENEEVNGIVHHKILIYYVVMLIGGLFTDSNVLLMRTASGVTFCLAQISLANLTGESAQKSQM